MARPKWPALLLAAALAAAWAVQPAAAGAVAEETQAPAPAGEAQTPAQAEEPQAPAVAEETGTRPDDPAEPAPPEEVGEEESGSRLEEEALPLQLESVPARPRPLLELGEPFLGTGTLRPGFELPTGAVWQPSLLVFGTLRTALQSFDSDGARVVEWADRLDLFANLYLSGTERVVLGFRPLDRSGRFTSYAFRNDAPGGEDGWQEELNAEITSVFFEGDFGEIFPNLSRDDFHRTDIGFSVGRQPLIFQEGLLIADSIDGLGLTRNTLQPRYASNLRTTLFWGWNDVGRPDRPDGSAQMLALLSSLDLRRSTLDIDLAWVGAGEEGDLLAGGVSAVQRIGRANTSFYLLTSQALGDETESATDGYLGFSEVGWTPGHGNDYAYFTAFWAVDEFTSAARGPDAGGPLGRAGINFAAAGIGRFGAPLDSTARDVAGGALGYQRFFADTRRQLVLELAGRFGTAGASASSFSAMARYQVALGRRFVVVLDAFAGQREVAAGGTDDLLGGRVEMVLKF